MEFQQIFENSHCHSQAEACDGMDVTNQSSSTETASFLFDEVNSDLIESGVNSDLIDNESTNGESATMDHVHDSMEKDREVILRTILEQELQTICKSLVCKFNICRNNIWEGTKIDVK